MSSRSLLCRHTSVPARLLASFLWALVLATASPQPPQLLVALVLVALLTWDVRDRLGTWLRRLGPALLVVAAVLAPTALVNAELALLRLARATLATASVVALTVHVRPADVAGALRALRLPPIFVGVVETMLRQSSVLGSEARTLVLARRLRGGTGLGAGPGLLVELFERSLARAERADLAARLRGYAPGSMLHAAPFQPLDVVLLLTTLGAGAVLHTLVGAG